MFSFTDDQKEKITAEATRLREEAIRLETKAQRADGVFIEALKEYGSELAGQPSSIRENRREARELRIGADFLDRMKSTTVSPEFLLSATAQRLGEIKNEIADLERKIREEEELMVLLDGLTSVLDEESQ